MLFSLANHLLFFSIPESLPNLGGDTREEEGKEDHRDHDPDHPCGDRTAGDGTGIKYRVIPEGGRQIWMLPTQAPPPPGRTGPHPHPPLPLSPSSPSSIPKQSPLLPPVAHAWVRDSPRPLSFLPPGFVAAPAGGALDSAGGESPVGGRAAAP